MAELADLLAPVALPEFVAFAVLPAFLGLAALAELAAFAALAGFAALAPAAFRPAAREPAPFAPAALVDPAALPRAVFDEPAVFAPAFAEPARPAVSPAALRASEASRLACGIAISSSMGCGSDPTPLARRCAGTRVRPTCVRPCQGMSAILALPVANAIKVAKPNTNKRPPRRRRAGLPAAALVAALVSVSALVLTARADTGAARSAARVTVAQAKQLGLQAYVYGYPLLLFMSQQATHTSVTVPDSSGDAPLNQLSNVRDLASPSGKLAVQPNNDTLYSEAFLDLSKGPMVLHVPRIGGQRYYSFEFLDPFTNVFAYVGTRKTGDGAHTFLITGPEWHGQAPRHVRVVRSHYDHVWLLGRTFVRGSSDLDAVHKIQNNYLLLPLSDFTRFGLHWHRPQPQTVVQSPTPNPLPIGLPFFDALGKALAANPPPTADGPLLASLRAVGIGPGLEPSNEQLTPAIVAGLTAAANSGQTYIELLRQQLFSSSVSAHQGWFVPPPSTGKYGTDYNLRAVIAQSGPGANRPVEAMYVIGVDDAKLLPLDGANTYLLHFPSGQLPPAKYFWSLTMYDAAFLLVRNPLNRYEISGRTPGLQRGADGSLDVYLSHTQPAAGQSNWLPAPIGHFEVTLRIYGPSQAALDGSYQYPSITTLPPTP